MQALKSDNAAEWQNAMENEIEPMKENEIYTVVPLPEGKKIVGSRWVYNIKDNPDSEVKYKARF